MSIYLLFLSDNKNGCLNTNWTFLASSNGSPCEDPDFICYNGGYCVEDPRLPDGRECHCPEQWDGDQCDLCKFDKMYLECD